MESAETNIRMPGILVPSYRKIISTEEGRTAMKRIRVECGVCRATRFYSIHRGITRIYGVVACEACRHFYQRFNRHPFNVQCAKEGRCFEQDDFLQKKCKACWVAQIISHCPVNKSLFNKFSTFLPPDIRSELTGPPTSLEQLTEQERGGLGLEIYSNNDWVDVTEDKEENFTYTVDIDDGFEPDVGMDFEAEEEMIDDPGAVESSNIDEDSIDGPSTSTTTTTTTRHRHHRAPAGVRQDMDPDDRVMALQLEGLHVNNQNKFMENFNPKTSERVRRKKKKVQYFSGTGRGKKEQVAVHDSEGRLTVSGQDLCDCLLSDCLGCHFTCPKCSSSKCGKECRISRKWCYESVEVEGTKLKWRNEFLKK